MNSKKRKFLTRTLGAAAFAATAALAMGATSAQAQIPEVRIGLLSFGTVNWAADTIKNRAFDIRNGFELVVQGYGGNDATSIALQGGDVDVIITDAFWVSKQRAQGNDFVWVPYSNTVGGVIVRNDSGINSVEDLIGKNIGIAGGPVDKSWLLLQAWTLDQLGMNIRDAVGEVKFGNPFLVNNMISKGEVDAVMSFWNWNARLLNDSDNYHQLIGTGEILGVLGVEGTVPLLGWTFSEAWAEANPDAIAGFLKASQDATQLLATSDQAWATLKGRMNVTDNPSLFETYMTNYRAGIVSSFDADDQARARQAFSILSELGGEALMGPNPELEPGTFWGGFAF
jgi:NitT/TauT family transport system substrate-binding protein